MTDKAYMRRALELAKKGEGWTAPNPMVGAVIVKEGRIIGEGFHERYGEPHAERNALASCQEDPKGADLYVTLEPCCHYGKQPPCTEAILAAGIRKVIVGCGSGYCGGMGYWWRSICWKKNAADSTRYFSILFRRSVLSQ